METVIYNLFNMAHGVYEKSYLDIDKTLPFMDMLGNIHI